MKRKKSKKIMIVLIIFLILLALFIIVLPPSKGKLSQYKDDSGNTLDGSISEKISVTIGNTDIGMILLGEDINNPVLLFCGGGPGIPEYLLEDFYGSVLSKHFVVCYFDYRGTGLSIHDTLSSDAMNTEQYLNDVYEITDYLCNRFDTEKIYIMGHSFGTYVALNAAYEHPEKYTAYLAVSQTTKQYESECKAYDYMLNAYRTSGNKKMQKQLEKYSIYDSKEAFDAYRKSGVRDKAMHDLGVGTARDMKSVISDLFLKSLRCKSYTIGERIYIWRGKVKSHGFAVTKDTFSFNAFETIDTLKIPIYFFAGKFDYTCCEELQRQYYEFIDAPIKKYYLYPDSAHSPIFEDDELTDEFLQDILGSK